MKSENHYQEDCGTYLLILLFLTEKSNLWQICLNSITLVSFFPFGEPTFTPNPKGFYPLWLLRGRKKSLSLPSFPFENCLRMNDESERELFTKVYYDTSTERRYAKVRARAGQLTQDKEVEGMIMDLFHESINTFDFEKWQKHFSIPAFKFFDPCQRTPGSATKRTSPDRQRGITLDRIEI